MNIGRLRLWSEPYPPSGAIAASGVRNALGRPKMSIPTLLVRETVQNSWDAGSGTGVRPIDYFIDSWALTAEQQEALCKGVFCELPPSGTALQQVLTTPRTNVVVISDRGTSGLGGPTRADIDTGEVCDFADFVRNIGQPPDKPHGGGTYGYGKSVLFLASAASAVVVYSRYATDGAIGSRLIAMGLGSPFNAREGQVERRYTGRHWWGVPDADAGIEPLTGAEADAVAAALGMPEFTGEQLGTSLMVVGASFPDMEIEDAIREMASAVLWYCWPKTISLSGHLPDMRFRITHEGQPLTIPDPREHCHVRGFVAAYAAASGHPAGDILLSESHDILCGRPRQLLGRLGVVRFNTEDSGAGNEPGRPFQGAPHHTALMRAPRLVVSYLQGLEAPVSGIAWAGAFVADPDVDRAFAASEPPAHDDWIPNILPRSNEKRFVNVALKRIAEAAAKFGRPDTDSSEHSSSSPLAAFAGALGGLLAGDAGPGTRSLDPGDASSRVGTPGQRDGLEPTVQPESKRGGGPTRRRTSAAPRVVTTGSRLFLENGNPALEIEFTVTLGGSGPAVVRAEPRVAVNDGATIERERPVGAPTPRVLYWVWGERKLSTADLVVDGDGPLVGRVVVSIPGEMSVSVDLTAGQHELRSP
jgi:hypothetical protein